VFNDLWMVDIPLDYLAAAWWIRNGQRNVKGLLCSPRSYHI